MEPKAKTLQERFGFADADLKTPKHDAIMVWLDGEIDRIVSGQFGAEQWQFRAGVSWRVCAPANIRELEASANQHVESSKEQAIKDLRLPPRPTVWISKTWERPILNGKYIVGFADMFVRWSVQVVSFDFRADYGNLSYEGIGIQKRSCPDLYFEVKPSIPSAGELLRQLRLYKTYTMDRVNDDYPEWFVVSPDNRFRSIIENQGFGFIQVPPEVQP